ncbi:hypothetical protein NQ314_015936 [Rhamnusium bicolor]|uniref:Wbp11/ELF5/Saf1 N-terminal domain-containing protein n=1 Tax=Rhamnusium bicolor TaxID=1586634 RepID=A0AAV8WY71_9CUCU|nr:hypothetical protein NQ314_015936 [Rhamnusium bicolor]
MGRRSINTTKSGKYMNPTDQARKEARKQELKKNKKQRQMVRAAVLKGKDPQQILEEMEKIDQMEYNVNQPSPLNEKVLKDKRKEIERYFRKSSDYYKDDPEKWADLKRRQTEYEQKRNQLVAFYESVKSAQQVTVDEIPLPQLPQQPVPSNTAAQIPLPTTERKQEHTIYSIATALKLQALASNIRIFCYQGQPVREPPGCPPGPSPEINDDGEVEEFTTKTAEDEKEMETEETTSDTDVPIVKPTSLQQKMVALSGQNVDEFIKEMETVQKKLEISREEENRAKLTVHIEPLVPPGTSDSIPTLPSHAPSNPPAPPPHMFPNSSIRLPPGPPPGRPLMPPGPPPGLPPRLPLRMPQQGATISAKPQIRNLSADVTRFVPSALRVKREDKKPKQNPSALVRELKQKEYNMHQNAISGHHTKDDAYKQFMQEMEQLL